MALFISRCVCLASARATRSVNYVKSASRSPIPRSSTNNCSSMPRSSSPWQLHCILKQTRCKAASPRQVAGIGVLQLKQQLHLDKDRLCGIKADELMKTVADVQVWVHPHVEAGKIFWEADSDSALTKVRCLPALCPWPCICLMPPTQPRN